jgi:hypothetical protein
MVLKSINHFHETDDSLKIYVPFFYHLKQSCLISPNIFCFRLNSSVLFILASIQGSFLMIKNVFGKNVTLVFITY